MVVSFLYHDHDDDDDQRTKQPEFQRKKEKSFDSCLIIIIIINVRIWDYMSGSLIQSIIIEFFSNKTKKNLFFQTTKKKNCNPFFFSWPSINIIGYVWNQPLSFKGSTICTLHKTIWNHFILSNFVFFFY